MQWVIVYGRNHLLTNLHGGVKQVQLGNQVNGIEFSCLLRRCQNIPDQLMHEPCRLAAVDVDVIIVVPVLHAIARKRPAVSKHLHRSSHEACAAKIDQTATQL